MNAKRDSAVGKRSSLPSSRARRLPGSSFSPFQSNPFLLLFLGGKSAPTRGARRGPRRFGSSSDVQPLSSKVSGFCRLPGKRGQADLTPTPAKASGGMSGLHGRTGRWGAFMSRLSPGVSPTGPVRRRRKHAAIGGNPMLRTAFAKSRETPEPRDRSDRPWVGPRAWPGWKCSSFLWIGPPATEGGGLPDRGRAVERLRRAARRPLAILGRRAFPSQIR
jgi:hypothetical protein